MNAPRTLPEFIEQFDLIMSDVDYARALRHLTFLTVNGPVTVSWQPGSDNAVIDLRAITPTGAAPANQLPAQANNTGKVLTTDGATLSWL